MPSKPYILNCTTHSLKNRQSNWSTNRLVPREDLVPLQQSVQRLKILSVDRHLPCLFFYLCPCLGVDKITSWTLFRWARAKSTFPKAFMTLWRAEALLTSFSEGPPNTIVCWPQFWFMRLFFTKERSSGSCWSTFVRSFALSHVLQFSPPKWSRLPKNTCCPMSKKHDPSSSTLPCSQVTSSAAHCPNSSSQKSSTMNVLRVLPP